MKLSNLKSRGFSKRIKFVDGEMIKVSEDIINGEINFYELTSEKLISINDNVITKMVKDVSDEEFAYMLLPEICDIEIDVTVDEFVEMAENPSKQFVEFMEILLSEISSIFDLADSLMNIEENTKKMTNFQIDKPIVKELTKEEKLDSLYDKLSLETDRTVKREIMKEISNLELE